jgi:phage shock protein E
VTALPLTRPSAARRTGLALAALLVVGCAGASADEPTLLAADEAVTVLAEDDVEVIDVRTPEEYEEGHVIGAMLIDFQSDDVEQQLDELERDQTYVLYCRTGNRSGQAAELMDELGFTDVYDAGAYDDLAEEGAPVSS